MSRQVQVFPLPLIGSLQPWVLSMGAKVVHVGLNMGAPAMWVEYDPYGAPAGFEFTLVNTGMHLPDGFVHLGSVELYGEMRHLYWRGGQ